MGTLSQEMLNSKYRKEDEIRNKERIDGLTQENLKLRMKIDELERGRVASEDGIRLQLQRAEETIVIERG